MNVPIYVVGGGPSVKQFDMDKLDGKFVIAVNQSYRICHDAQLIVSMDNRWYTSVCRKPNYMKHTGQKVMVEPRGYSHTYPHSVRTVVGDWGVTNRGPICTVDQVSTGNSSGFAAICLALALTTAQIRLIGFDMNGPYNWHSDYPSNWKPSDAMQGIQRAYFEWMAIYHGKRILNLNPDSGIKGFRTA